jgi:hypothetical protein
MTGVRPRTWPGRARPQTAPSLAPRTPTLATAHADGSRPLERGDPLRLTHDLAATGGGGVARIEADSAATLAKTTAPWTSWLQFTATPIVPIEDASAISNEAVGFRDSVG